MEVPGSKWATPAKVIQNNRAKILWDFQIQTDKMVVADLMDILEVDKQEKKAIRMMERMWGLKTSVVSGGTGALRAVTS